MKPFLKWAGGKHRLVPRIQELLPRGKRLVEPFLGSGAVFLGLEYDDYLLADANEDLIALYSFLKTPDVAAFIDETEALFRPENNTTEAYYRLREEFNSLARGSRRRAQLFIYLNRHCFNGLCRMNKNGGFNVPFGKMKAPYFPRTEMQDFAVKAQRAEFRVADFRDIMRETVRGDVIYVDPPYSPLTPTASFDAYSAGGFSDKDHEDLARLCFECAERGVPVVLSNHDTPVTRKLYEGAQIHSLKVTRSVSGNSDSRNKAAEILVLFERKALMKGPLIPGLLDAA